MKDWDGTASGHADEYKQENDPLANFLDEACRFDDPEATVSAMDLYRHYDEWAGASGLGWDKLSMTAFGRAMAGRFQKKNIDVPVSGEAVANSDLPRGFIIASPWHPRRVTPIDGREFYHSESWGAHSQRRGRTRPLPTCAHAVGRQT